MKKGLIIFVAALLSVAAIAQNKITKLEIQGCEVTLIQAKTFSYQIDAKHNALVDIIISKDKLIVERNKDKKSQNNNETRIPITLYVSQIDELQLSDSQLNYTGSFGSKHLKLGVSASSDVTLNQLNIKQLDIDASSSAKLNIAGKISDLKLDASSSSNCNINIVANKIKVDASSSANISLKGESKVLIAGASSSANINASHLHTQQVNSSHSSGGGVALAQLSKTK